MYFGSEPLENLIRWTDWHSESINLYTITFSKQFNVLIAHRKMAWNIPKFFNIQYINNLVNESISHKYDFKMSGSLVLTL